MLFIAVLAVTLLSGRSSSRARVGSQTRSVAVVLHRSRQLDDARPGGMGAQPTPSVPLPRPPVNEVSMAASGNFADVARSNFSSG